MVVDMLMGKNVVDNGSAGPDSNGTEGGGSACWWLSESPRVLKFDRTKLIRNVIIPEMSKNRSLQRVTNEISVEVNALTPEQ
jgi:hypothetical protein